YHSTREHQPHAGSLHFARKVLYTLDLAKSGCTENRSCVAAPPLAVERQDTTARVDGTASAPTQQCPNTAVPQHSSGTVARRRAPPPSNSTTAGRHAQGFPAFTNHGL